MSTTATSELRTRLGPTFTYGEARQARIGDKRIYGMRDRGEIIALGGGLYRWADAPPADSDLVEIAARASAATLCLETALARHNLTDAIPSAIDIAIPRGATRPALRAPCRIHQFDRRTFHIGRGVLDVGGPHSIGLYSAERSLIDVIRMRHREGADLAWQALRRWLARPGNHPAALMDMARQLPRAESALRRAIEILG